MDKQIYYPAGIYHVTLVTHNSRISQRMLEYNIKKGNGVWFDENSEVKITEIIKNIFHCPYNNDINQLLALIKL